VPATRFVGGACSPCVRQCAAGMRKAISATAHSCHLHSWAPQAKQISAAACRAGTCRGLRQCPSVAGSRRYSCKRELLSLPANFTQLPACALILMSRAERQAVHELHKILGQMDLLGSPIVLTTSLVAGVARFFAEPAKARPSMREHAHPI
jgi:hypothetical protein